ncbi:MAG TPA: DUF5071 domain-containing protein [Polyangiaceae bacterium]|nr:DUF5071 domain-containing protein [Polyangiaceae bacterium]
MPIDDLLTLMQRFVSGEAMALDDAKALEGELLQRVPDYPELEELADDFAWYRPEGGEFLFDHARMKLRVAHHLDALRARLPGESLAGPSDPLRSLVPTGKSDLERARAAVEVGYPAVAPVLGELVGWLQDYNWPVAHVLVPFLQSIGAPLVPHIWHVLRSDDDVWKYWVISLLIPSLSENAAATFRQELVRLSRHPRPTERGEMLDEEATVVLEHFGWPPNGA